MTPEQRSTRAKIAAHSSWAKTPDRTARTAAAREGMQAKFEREVDPTETLSPEERAKRVASARKAHYLRMAARSAAVRRKRST